MTKDEILRELEAAIRSQKEAECRIEIAKLKLEFGFDSKTEPSKQKKGTAADLFLTAHPDLNNKAGAVEFLYLGEVSTKQVADFLTKNGHHETTSATVSRHIGVRYSAGPTDTEWKRMVDTISVLRYHFYRCQPLNDKPTALGRSSSPSKVQGDN